MSKLTGLKKLAEAHKSIELSIDDQAIIIGLAVKVSNQGVPYFTKAVATDIKKALVEEKIATTETVLFEKLKTTQADAWFKPVNGWLDLETHTEDEVETI